MRYRQPAALRRLWRVFSLVTDRPLFTRVDLGARSSLEQESRHVSRQERSGLRIHHVEPIVVDEHCLLLAPVCPALPADLFHHSRTNRTGKRWTLESLARLPTARAGYISHAYDLAYWIFARPNSERSLRYTQPISSSYHFALNFAERGSAWWLLCSSSPPSQIAIGEML